MGSFWFDSPCSWSAERPPRNPLIQAVYALLALSQAADKFGTAVLSRLCDQHDTRNEAADVQVISVLGSGVLSFDLYKEKWRPESDDKADSFNLWPIVQCLRDPQCIACFPVKGWAPTDVGLSTAALAAMLTQVERDAVCDEQQAHVGSCPAAAVDQAGVGRGRNEE
mmetsp:Transcript_2325/g.6037  ORF Transcript_2325/g.6037 Transcript_2325/m.6037 type:complete len:167 (-) Transcript_2325:56-556(-)